MRQLRASFLCLLALWLAGCQTMHQFANPDASWQQSIGQLRYAYGKKVLVGDVVVRLRGSEDFQLEFQKAAGFPLLTVRQEAGTTRVEGLLARGKWQGRAESAPRALRSWVHLREALTVPPVATAAASWQIGHSEKTGDRLTAVALRYPATGETFDFHFSP